MLQLEQFELLNAALELTTYIFFKNSADFLHFQNIFFEQTLPLTLYYLINDAALIQVNTVQVNILFTVNIYYMQMLFYVKYEARTRLMATIKYVNIYHCKKYMLFLYAIECYSKAIDMD